MADASSSTSMPATEFGFTFSVTGKWLKSVQPQSALELTEEFLTVVNGLAFLWNIKLGPELSFVQHEAEKGLAVILSLGNNTTFQRERTGEVYTRVDFAADIQCNVHRENVVFSYTISDFLANPWGLGQIMSGVSVPIDGELTAKVRLRISSLKIGQYLPDQPISTLSLLQQMKTLLAVEKSVKECPDVSIQCSDGVIQSIRALLSAISPYYATAFLHNETNGLEVGKLNHETFSKKVVNEFLRCLYTGVVAHSVKQLFVKEKMDLFRLADFVESPVSLLLTRHLTRTAQLDTLCDYKDLTLGFSRLGPIEESLDTLQFADTHSLAILRNLTLAHLSRRKQEIDNSSWRTEHHLKAELWQAIDRFHPADQRVTIVSAD